MVRVLTDEERLDWLRLARAQNVGPVIFPGSLSSTFSAAAALAALDLIRGRAGVELLSHLRAVTQRFRDGLVRLGFETIPGQHPVVPLLVRDTERTRALVEFLRENGVLATGLNFPVVPRGEQLIRFQVAADHTEDDIDAVLAVLSRFK